MNDRRASRRQRTFLSGKIVFNSGSSAIDCTVRNLSKNGACLQVNTPIGVPEKFYLKMYNDNELRACEVAWRSSERVGVAFEQEVQSEQPAKASPSTPDSFEAALEQVGFGVVLLDHELRAQFINRAFRIMFKLPDAKAENRPPFVALMYHGRDTQTYELEAEDVDQYVADRVALVKAGNTVPIDIRLSNGEVLRFQCAVLPNGGRMLSYTNVTDIVRHADELEVLTAALDRVREGIVLLDSRMNAQFINQSVRQLWHISDEQAQARPNIAELVGDAMITGTYGIARELLPNFIEQRIVQIRDGDPSPTDLQTSDGRIIRSQCDRLPSGGRMLTYCDVTDLVRNAEKMESLATIDPVTGISNRRHFLAKAEAEWNRFRRYQRPLSMLLVDIDFFKLINDRFGHDLGDTALCEVANALQRGRRASDIIGRFGGDEFVVLLPETDINQARLVGERLCASVRALNLMASDQELNLSISVGGAQAQQSMPGASALTKVADEALYEAKSNGRNRVAVAPSIEYLPNIAAE